MEQAERDISCASNEKILQELLDPVAVISILHLGTNPLLEAQGVKNNQRIIAKSLARVLEVG
jgi:hypothetical protein